jgi:hypothetical protein
MTKRSQQLRHIIKGDVTIDDDGALKSCGAAAQARSNITPPKLCATAVTLDPGSDVCKAEQISRECVQLLRAPRLAFAHS